MILAIIILAALLVLSILLNSWALALLLRPALRCADGGSRAPGDVAAGFAGLLVDVLGRLTWWRVLAGDPYPGEKTISDSLERLCGPGWEWHPRRALFVEIAREINRNSPTGRHIKAVLS